VGELPELDPDATLAARLAARTALEAARQPVTPAQLAARLEPETAAAANDARATWEAA
jgi:hypothetical protein